ncbi:alpha beta-hydrolase [Salix suchowensis]|nr:alpha beta-hydrolase [Salix suchowensis]
MERLKTQQAEIRTKYKLSSRRRRGLLDALTGHLEGSVVEYSAPTLRIVDELADTCLQLDELTEDLDSVDEQLSQLTSLCEVHSSSALAMALRKLNTSFLKQMQENKALKEQIETLQAERDEAWKQAQEVANDYDDLTGRIDSAVPDSAGCRSSKVMAVRKSSIRASKAGLRSTSSFRRSQRSSVSSNGQRNSVASVSALAVSPMKFLRCRRFLVANPLILLPIYRLEHHQYTAYSNGVTPTSETRALVRAQEELYDMLGITLRETHTALRRSHSVSDRPPDFNISTLYPSGDSRQRYSDASSGGPGTRRSSMPNHTGLHQVYTAMTADVSQSLALE